MARIRTDLAHQYVNDFGQQAIRPVPFKIHRDAPIPADYYTNRVGRGGCGSANLPYKPRYLLATFEDVNGVNGSFKYPVQTKAGTNGIIELATALITLGASCIDLVGERWNLVTGSVFPGAAPSYRTAPYGNIPGEPEKTSVNYTYNSDIAANIGGQFILSTSFETLPTELASVSANCLIGVQEKQGVSICSGSSLGIKPRRFLWKAGATDSANGTTIDGTISRQSIVSSADSPLIITCLQQIAPFIFCAGYRGEDINNVQNIASLA